MTGCTSVDLRVAAKSRKRRADRRLAGNGPVLLGNVAAGALAPPGRDDDSRNHAHHGRSARDSGNALAHVPGNVRTRLRSLADSPHGGASAD